MGTHIGRFSVETGVNFNREYPEVVSGVVKRVDGQLSTTDSEANVRLIREAMHAEIVASKAVQEEVVMKKLLYSMAVGADVVLDLHCDSHAVMHMYTHDRLWPSVADLAAELGSECHLLAPAAGGNPFDEACSCPWADLADKFPSFPIPMACEGQSVNQPTRQTNKQTIRKTIDYSENHSVSLCSFSTIFIPFLTLFSLSIFVFFLFL